MPRTPSPRKPLLQEDEREHSTNLNMNGHGGNSDVFPRNGGGGGGRMPVYVSVIMATFIYTFLRSGVKIQTSFLPTEVTSALTVTRLAVPPSTTACCCNCSCSSSCNNNNCNNSTSTNQTSYSQPPPLQQPTSSTLPTCKSLMEQPSSPYRDGAFLTRSSIPVSWHPRMDHSRELRHSMCELHRYTATEARQCLAGKHVNFIGDSLTRYQYLSLIWFLHKGNYPPRFGRSKGQVCPHVNETGHKVCSKHSQPSVVMEGDWNGYACNINGNIDRTKDAWLCLMQTLGGPKYFDGYLESNSVRYAGIPDANIVENYFYVTPPEPSSGAERVYMSYNSEIGWGNNPLPLHGFTYTGCAFVGRCNYTDDMAKTRVERAQNLQFDFSQPLLEAISANGTLRELLPPINIALYNRGLWGPLQGKEKMDKLFETLYDFSQGEKGRCYFRASTGRFESTLQQERTEVRKAVLTSGCGYIDVSHLVEDFNQLHYKWPKNHNQEYGNVLTERDFVYFDAVHFTPWVYEELNNVLLNVLCNNK